MTKNRPGVSATPNQITKIEICCIGDIRVEVRVYSTLHAKAEIFEFPDKASAIDFCHKIWLRRTPGARPTRTKSSRTG
jgi:hypothetical protein